MWRCVEVVWRWCGGGEVLCGVCAAVVFYLGELAFEGGGGGDNASILSLSNPAMRSLPFGVCGGLRRLTRRPVE